MRLTKRQAEVLQALLGGLSDKEIADRLCISLSCAKFHVQRIFRKYKVHDRQSLAGKFGRFEVEVRWVPLPRRESEDEEHANNEPRSFSHRVRTDD
jgi:DNA-binding CsgD family transcriptional regulator